MSKEKRENKIKELMSSAMKDLNSLVDVDTVVGKPIKSVDGTVIIPISKVTMGFLTGGGEYGEVKIFKSDNTMPFAGGSGAVVSIKPSGFLIDDGVKVKIISLSDDPLSKLVETANEFIKGFKNEEDI